MTTDDLLCSETPVVERPARVRLHERWQYASLSQAGERLPALANTLVPGGPAAAVLIPAEGGAGPTRFLSDDVAGPVHDLAREGQVAVADSGLPPEALRALELDGTLRVTPPTPPLRDWLRAAGEEDSISIEALRWGAMFSDLPAHRLATRLYFFGRYPVTNRWARELPDEDSVARWLGLGQLEAELHGLRLLARTTETWVWRRWARSPRVQAASKLYVCCVPDDLPSTVRACTSVIRQHPAVTGFKIGFDLPTVLRPDKFVVYLADAGAADELAASIVDAVGPADVHPLPFTAVTSIGGFVAQATDPEDWIGRPAWHERASWRLHICRLAAETLWVHRDRTWVERVAAALERLSLAGIDTQRWSWRDA